MKWEQYQINKLLKQDKSAPTVIQKKIRPARVQMKPAVISPLNITQRHVYVLCMLVFVCVCVCMYVYVLCAISVKANIFLFIFAFLLFHLSFLLPPYFFSRLLSCPSFSSFLSPCLHCQLWSDWLTDLPRAVKKPQPRVTGPEDQLAVITQRTRAG